MGKIAEKSIQTCEETKRTKMGNIEKLMGKNIRICEETKSIWNIEKNEKEDNRKRHKRESNWKQNELEQLRPKKTEMKVKDHRRYCYIYLYFIV